MADPQITDQCCYVSSSALPTQSGFLPFDVTVTFCTDFTDIHLDVSSAAMSLSL